MKAAGVSFSADGGTLSGDGALEMSQRARKCST